MARARTPRMRQRGKKAELLELVRQMMLIRRFEEKAAEMYARGRIAGLLHLYIGQEAIGVGAIACLGPEDYVISHYREHGQVLPVGRHRRRGLALGFTGIEEPLDVVAMLWEPVAGEAN